MSGFTGPIRSTPDVGGGLIGATAFLISLCEGSMMRIDALPSRFRPRPATRACRPIHGSSSVEAESGGTFSGMVRGILVMLAALVSGCSSTTDPLFSDGLTVDVHVTGGFAGVDYQFQLSSRNGEVVATECRAGCPFQKGQVLAQLTASQTREWVEFIDSVDIPSLHGTDYGTECCDQFQIGLTVVRDGRRGTITGTEGRFPAEIRDLIEELLRLTQGTAPIVVGSDAENLPADAFELGDVEIVGDILAATVSYGGGCEHHDFVLGFAGSWLESSPVQATVGLGHDDHDDPCDAYPTETRLFDLSALARAYRAAYPSTQVGQGELRLNLFNTSAPDSVHTLLYRF